MCSVPVDVYHAVYYPVLCIIPCVLHVYYTLCSTHCALDYISTVHTDKVLLPVSFWELWAGRWMIDCSMERSHCPYISLSSSPSCLHIFSSGVKLLNAMLVHTYHYHCPFIIISLYTYLFMMQMTPMMMNLNVWKSFESPLVFCKSLTYRRPEAPDSFYAFTQPLLTLLGHHVHLGPADEGHDTKYNEL